MPDNASGPPIGTVLDGKYRVTKQIGRGGMAVILSAENIDIGKPVAVKVLSRELADSRTVTERFLREARAAAKIKSPYICEVYDVGTFDDRPFIVMELLQGESLYDRLARERRLSKEDVSLIIGQVCKGLAKAHAQQIVHRDLKPENIFLTTTEDGKPLSKLVDFGLAKFYEPHNDPSNARLTKEGALFGTPAYMSPEQAKAKNNVDQRSDLWALGCIVYEMLTGRTVWDVEQGVAMILAQVATAAAPDPSKYRPDLPPMFGSWFKKALARKVEDRFQSALEFSTQLDEALQLSPPGELKSSVNFARPSPPESRGVSPLLPVGSASPLPPAIDESGPATERSPARRPVWPWVVLVVAALGVGGFFGLRALPASSTSPVETAPYAETVARAQGELLDQDYDEAKASFEAAFEQGKAKAARSFVSHVTAMKELEEGPCTAIAVGHPRPFDATKESSKPSIVATREGNLVTWAAEDSSGGRTTAYTALLDDALRRISEPIDVTPRATFVREPELIVHGESVGLSYWDFAGEAAGAYVSKLDALGRSSGPSHLLGSQEKAHPYYPSLAKSPEGGYVVVYVEPTRERVHDLMVRKLDDTFTPTMPAVALTGYATPRSGKIQAARPSVAFVGDLLHVAFTIRRPASQELLLLRVPLAGIRQGAGVEPAPADKAPTGGNEELDRYLGQAMTLSVGDGKFDLATLRCMESGCFAAWDKPQSAAELAFIDPQGKVVWRRQLTGAGPASGARPGIVLSERGVLAAWYEGDRVLVAPVEQNNPIVPSVVGRVAAVLQQPQPLLTRDAGGGTLVAWRGYEAAVPEPFVARVSCK